jgi:hypothetical protein
MSLRRIAGRGKVVSTALFLGVASALTFGAGLAAQLTPRKIVRSGRVAGAYYHAAAAG